MAPSATTTDARNYVYPNIDDAPANDEIYLNNPDPEHDVHIPNQLLGSKRKLRVVVLGSGLSGINFFKFAEEKASNLEIRCYEKNEDIGGTWLENRYPGCACDVPGLDILLSLSSLMCGRFLPLSTSFPGGPLRGPSITPTLLRYGSMSRW